MTMEVDNRKWANRLPPLNLTDASVCPNETNCCWTNLQKPPKITKKSWQDSSYRIPEDDLPLDPRDWTRAHVWKWLNDLATMEGLTVTPDMAEKFPMNGKALCLMTMDMYLNRVPFGGKTLYRDFRLRMARAMSL
ncbi:uncharacterized protein LOC129792012 [Lutzomyia longipalpis]|uniref:uncharacterized protein LOC129792012 n=1 Tax=Lutzomyia longipalpis TaxID=7200 RepID=UPI00248399EB|nr:uncharacterized protein LOC129792012 [Lutzomyia longipalpis]